MIIDLQKLKSNIINSIEINETYSFSKEQLKNTQIIKLDEVNIVGNIMKGELNEYIINIRVYGTMILPCNITLKPTNYDFDFEINGNILEMFEEIGENDKKFENSLDILPIIWENILTEVPMRVVSEDAYNIDLEGEGWRVITEETISVNPGLEKLKDLL